VIKGRTGRELDAVIAAYLPPARLLCRCSQCGKRFMARYPNPQKRNYRIVFPVRSGPRFCSRECLHLPRQKPSAPDGK